MAKINDQVDRVLAAIDATPAKLKDKKILSIAEEHVAKSIMPYKALTRRRLRELAKAAA